VTIEFHCPFCQKLLKTADDKAGVRANCPGCGEAVTVPVPGHEAAQADSSLTPSGDPARALATEGTGLDSVSAEAAGAPEETRPCPMCGAQIKRTARRCRFCGETLVEQRIDAGYILSRTWEIYKKQLGILIAAFLIVAAIAGGVSITGSTIQQGIISAIGRGGGGNNAGAGAAVIFMTLLFTAVNMAVSAYLQAGLHIVLLRLGRGENVEIADLFTGGRYFWRFFWGTLLFQLMIGFGFLLLIVPGIILSFMFWPFLYVIVDRDEGIIDSLRLAQEATSGTYMVVFLLFLAGLVIMLLGIFPGMCIGLLFTIPFWMLLWAVTYCVISGKPIPKT
jgi:uncharacterized membrane protein/phage FluMu protein Com